MEQALDLIQSRYGWTDEQVVTLPYSRFAEILRTIHETKESEERDRLTVAAFIGWQNYMVQPREKGRPIGFDKWLKKLGIVQPSNDKLKGQERDDEIRRAKRIAQEVTQAFGSGSTR